MLTHDPCPFLEKYDCNTTQRVGLRGLPCLLASSTLPCLNFINNFLDSTQFSSGAPALSYLPTRSDYLEKREVAVSIKTRFFFNRKPRITQEKPLSKQIYIFLQHCFLLVNWKQHVQDTFFIDSIWYLSGLLCTWVHESFPVCNRILLLESRTKVTKWESFIELMMITDHLPITRQQQLPGNWPMIFGWSPNTANIVCFEALFFQQR